MTMADDTERGGGAACSKAERVREMLTRWRNEDASINEAYARVSKLSVELRHTLGVLENGDASADECGIELLRISNQLATESKRLRGPSAPMRATRALLASEDPNACFTPLPGGGECSKHFAHDGACGSPEVTPSGGAEALPGGWTRDEEWKRWLYQGSHATHVSKSGDKPGMFFWRTPSDHGHAPSAEQAMCAALRIPLNRDSAHGFTCPLVTFSSGGLWPYEDADALARAALESFHARQQTTPAPADDACVCSYRDDGHRDVSRFCTLHGASWQTLAEQRSELHEDGTPRAGCPVCSAPELDARERGLPR